MNFTVGQKFTLFLTLCTGKQNFTCPADIHQENLSSKPSFLKQNQVSLVRKCGLIKDLQHNLSLKFGLSHSLARPRLVRRKLGKMKVLYKGPSAPCGYEKNGGLASIH